MPRQRWLLYFCQELVADVLWSFETPGAVLHVSASPALYFSWKLCLPTCAVVFIISGYQSASLTFEQVDPCSSVLRIRDDKVKHKRISMSIPLCSIVDFCRPSFLFLVLDYFLYDLDEFILVQ